MAQLCRRLAVATEAGLTDRRTWSQEAERGGRAQRAAVGAVSAEIARGRSIDEALAAAGSYFPPLFRQLVAVGERSGRVDRTYRRLADHYDQMLTARRTLLGALAWPAIQLGIALATIGAVIWISSALDLKTVNGEPLDLFGLGLTGSSGLAVYVTLLITAAIAVLLLVESGRRGMLWTRRLQRAALGAPGIGGALETLALSRFTWAMQLVLDTDMDLRQALPLALEATAHDAYRKLGPQVARSIGQGATLHEALAATGKFPSEMLDAVAVGEQSGMLAETMQRQSKEYEIRAIGAIGLLARVLGGVVWIAVGVLLVVLIFRVFNAAYLEPIQQLSAPGGGT